MRDFDNIPELLTPSGVALRFGVTPSTALRRLKAADVKPSGYLHRGPELEPSPLFSSDRLPDLQSVILTELA